MNNIFIEKSTRIWSGSKLFWYDDKENKYVFGTASDKYLIAIDKEDALEFVTAIKEYIEENENVKS